MFEHFKRLVKDSLIYGLGRILPKAIGFFLIPIYTRFLTPKDYGILSIVNMVISIFSLFFLFGQDSAVARFYFDYDKKKSDSFKAIVTNILTFLPVVNALFLTFLLLYGKEVFSSIFKSTEMAFDPYIKLGLFTVFLMIPATILVQIYRVEHKPLNYSTFQVANFLLSTSFIIYFVVALREGALGSIRGRMYATLVFFLLSLYLLKDYLYKIDIRKLRDSLKFGLPLVPHQISGWILTFADRYILERFTTLSVVGIYSLGYNFGMVMNVLSSSISLAWTPFYYQIVKSEKEGRRIVSKMTTLAATAIVTLGVVMILFSKEVILIMATERYYKAMIIIPAVIAGYIFQSIYTLVGTGIFYAKRTQVIPLITGSSAALNVVLNLIFIPKYGMIAAAYTTLFSFFWMLSATFYLSSKIFPIPYEKRSLLVLAFLLGGVIFVNLLIMNLSNIFLSLFVKFAIFLFYLVLVVLSGVIKMGEIKTLTKKIQDKLFAKVFIRKSTIQAQDIIEEDGDR